MAESGFSRLTAHLNPASPRESSTPPRALSTHMRGGGRKIRYTTAMASARGGAVGRLCKKYQVFFYVAALLISVQMYLAYSFWSLNQNELAELGEWKKRVEQLEKEHGVARNGTGARGVKTAEREAGRPVETEIGAERGPVALPQEELKDLSKLTGRLQKLLKEKDKYLRLPNDVAGNPDNQNGAGNHGNQVHKMDQGAADSKPARAQKVRVGDQKDQKDDNVPIANTEEAQKKAAELKRRTGVKGTQGAVELAYNITPKCELSSRDTLSALTRAKTTACRQEIADVACLYQQNKLYPQTLPRYCPLKDTVGAGLHVGCYKDETAHRILGGTHTEFKTDNTPQRCINYCLQSGFNVAGIQYGLECWCGSGVYHKAEKLAEAKCDYPCPGDKEKTCGGYLTTDIYKTGFGAKPDNKDYLVKPESLKDDQRRQKVAFVLTVNGRALRQVKRLFKAIYHTDHFYYIHVDSRQDYLYREMDKMAVQFPNVRVATQRYSSIWGGASLLSMHLQCMEDLLAMEDWHWDYFINLSESDFPLKPLDDLVAFLTQFQERNFVKSHGRDTPKFIRKQGMNQLFYECDNHMWRLGQREPQTGIRIDGGSDWFALNHEFIRYVVHSQDELVTGLKQYWKYTLLPSESFFHTVLINSKFCETYDNNHLHLTNWRRKQGCKCQYKHIVDWCGCSPNDFKPGDMDKILSTEEKTIYFGRKFEAVISQEIISELDAYLFGSYPEDTPGLNSYWQSDYHHDDPGLLDDATQTFYESFQRLGVQKLATEDTTCKFQAGDIQEVFIYNYVDNFAGMVIQYKGTSVQNGEQYTLETILQQQRVYRVHKLVGPITRLKHVEVGSGFDPKEEIFRNYGGLLGPESKLTLKLSWGTGKYFTLTAAFIDPAEVVAASYDIPVKEEEHVMTYQPEFSAPLRPGMWTVKLVYAWELVAETKFLIVPRALYNGKQLTPSDALALHSGPEKLYSDRDFSDMKSVLGLKANSTLLATAHSNACKTGEELSEWIDSVVRKAYRVSETCTEAPSPCQKIPLCPKTRWSSLSPDPKSEIGQVNPQSGRIR